MKISALFDILKDDISENNFHGKDYEIKNLAYDSRKALSGGLFVCLPGALTDGHKYIDACLEKGVSAFIVSDKNVFSKYAYSDADFFLVENSRKALAQISAEFFENPAEKLEIIGITGTKGKTSTSYMIKEILSCRGINIGIIGTVGIFFGNREEYIDNSTPESYELHRIFSEMLKCGVTHVVMEVSSQALKMYRTYGIKFSVGIFTNLSPDHIGESEHPDFEDYKRCKGILFSNCKKAVINADSQYFDYYHNIILKNNLPCITFSAKNKDCDFYGHDPVFLTDELLHTSFILDKCGKIDVNIPGEFSIYNALCACAVSSIFGADFCDMKNGLAKVSVLGRAEQVKNPKCNFSVIIDYAHNALSLESLFKSVMCYKPNNIFCVFGCGGNRSKLRRYDMGEISGKYASLSIITSDNPRFENLDDIICDIISGMKKTDGKYIIIKDRQKAIFHALSLAKAGDIVLIVGKGNQKYEEIRGEKIFFDEREVVKKYYEQQH